MDHTIPLGDVYVNDLDDSKSDDITFEWADETIIHFISLNSSTGDLKLKTYISPGR